MNRKALIREYKETPRPMGVYRVWHPGTGASIVAASMDLPSTLNRHRAQLRLGAHPTRALQAAWNEHGPDSIVFEILDTLPPPKEPDASPFDDLVVLEDLWLDKMASTRDRFHTITNAPGRPTRRT